MKHPLLWSVVAWWLRRRVPAPLLPAILGDLLEDYRRHRRATGPMLAELTLMREAASLARAYRHAANMDNALHRRRMRVSIVTIARHARRRWISRPALALTVVLTLALGIGSLTAIASVVDAVLLQPLPWRAADRLVTISLVRPEWRQHALLAPMWDRGPLVGTQVHDLVTHSRTLANVAAWRPGRPTLAATTPEAVPALYISSSFLPVLGVSPYVGRNFESHEDESATDAVLVAYGTWQRRYGASPAALGSHLTIDGTRRTIVGVTPPRFAFDPDHDPPEFYLPFGNASPSDSGYYCLARLAPGVTLADAFVDTEPIIRGTFSPAQRSARVAFLADDQLGRARTPLWMLFAAATLLFVIATSNVAALLLGDAGPRRSEMAVRTALGATRGDLFGQLMIEGLLLSAAGTGLGILLAAGVLPWLVSLAPARLPRIETVALSPGVLVVVAIISLLSTICFSVGPAFALAPRVPASALREVRVAGRRRRAQSTLVASEVALALVLLVVGSLFGETLFRLTSRRLGFDPSGVLIVTTRPASNSAESPGVAATRTHDILERLTGAPGVVAAAGVSTAPFSGGLNISAIDIEGRHFDTVPSTARQVVTASYFATMRVPVLTGRVFDTSDRAGDRVAVVSESFAKGYFDGQAIGRRFKLDDWWTIIGVVADTKQREFRDEATAAAYLLDRQAIGEHAYAAIDQFVIRTRGDGAAPASLLRDLVHSASPDTIVTDTTPMTALLDRSVGNQRYRAILASVFGGTALLLASVGLYGLLTRVVADRRREIGVRMALGARPGDVVAMVAGQGTRLVAIGLACGLPPSIAAGKLSSSLLFGVTPTMPHTFALVAGLLGTVSVVATVWPARRAAHVDPVVALRAD
jgi:putative ABC transport system permease protein